MLSARKGTGLLFSSDSLKSFLGVTSNNGGKKTAKQKKVKAPNPLESAALVQEILREESIYSNAAKPRRKKKRGSELGPNADTIQAVASATLPPKKAKLNSTVRRGARQPFRNRSDFDGVQERARIIRNLTNVHNFAATFGVVGDDISYLERQYHRINQVLLSFEHKLISAFEQLVSDTRPFTIDDADLLLSFANVEIDELLYNDICERSLKNISDSTVAVELVFSKWLIGICSGIRDRLMTNVLGGKYGLAAPSFLDQVDTNKPPPTVIKKPDFGAYVQSQTQAHPTRRLSVPGQTTKVADTEEFQEKLEIHRRVSYMQQQHELRRLSAGGSSGGPGSGQGLNDGGSGSEADEARPHPYLTEGRGGDDSGGEGGDPVRATISAMAARLVQDSVNVSIGSFSADPFGSRTSSANPLPDMSGRLKGSRGGSRPGSRPQSRPGSPRSSSSRLTDDERLTRISFQKGQSQFMSVADSQYAGGAVVGADLVQASILERSSIASGGTLHNSKSLSNLPPHLQSHSTTIATHSATTQFSLTQALPPIRLQQVKQKANKRKMFARAGFDESLGRATPRCLKGEMDITSTAPHSMSAYGPVVFNAPQPLTIKEKALTVDANSIQENIELLRRELAVANESVNFLDTCVDEDIAWVHTHCELANTHAPMNTRTVVRCRKMAVEKLQLTIAGYLQTTTSWGLQRWKVATKYDRLKMVTKKYARAKAIESTVRVTYNMLSRQYMKAWRPWLTMVIKQRKIEREIAATEMSRVVRGFLGRVRAQRVRVHKASVVIQCLGRQFNARRKVQRQRVYRAAVRMICFFSKLLKIKRAKQEVQRRRRNHAATRIQKRFRGGVGRARFAACKAEEMERLEKERVRQERLQQEEMERQARFEELQRRKQEEREKALADAKAKKEAALAAKKEKELEARRQKKLEKDAAAAAAKAAKEAARQAQLDAAKLLNPSSATDDASKATKNKAEQDRLERERALQEAAERERLLAEQENAKLSASSKALVQQVKRKYDALSQETAALKIQCVARGMNARKVSKFRLVDKHRARARLMGVTAAVSTGPSASAPPPALAPVPGNRKGSAGLVKEEVAGVAMVPTSSSPIAVGGENVDPNERSEPALVDAMSEPALLTAQPSFKASSSQRGNPFATTQLDVSVEVGSSELHCNVPDGCVPGMLVVIGEGLDNEEMRLIVGFASILVDQPLSHTHPVGTPLTIYDKSSDKPAPTAPLSDPPLPGTEVDQPEEEATIDVDDSTPTATDPEAENNADAAVDVDVKVVEGEDVAGGGGVAGTETDVEKEEEKTPQPDSSSLASTTDLEQPPPPSEDAVTTDTVTDEPIDSNIIEAVEAEAVEVESPAPSFEAPNVQGAAVDSASASTSTSASASMTKAASFSVPAPKKGVSDAAAAAANKRKHGSVATIPQAQQLKDKEATSSSSSGAVGSKAAKGRAASTKDQGSAAAAPSKATTKASKESRPSTVTGGGGSATASSSSSPTRQTIAGNSSTSSSPTHNKPSLSPSVSSPALDKTSGNPSRANSPAPTTKDKSTKPSTTTAAPSSSSTSSSSLAASTKPGGTGAQSQSQSQSNSRQASKLGSGPNSVANSPPASRPRSAATKIAPNDTGGKTVGSTPTSSRPVSAAPTSPPASSSGTTRAKGPPKGAPKVPSSSTMLTPEKPQAPPSGKSSPTNAAGSSSSGGGSGSRRGSNSGGAGGGGGGKPSPLTIAKSGGSAKGPSPSPSPKGPSPGPGAKSTSPGPGASKKPSRSGSPEALPTIIDFPILENTSQAGPVVDMGEPDMMEEGEGERMVDVEAIEQDALEDEDKGSDGEGVGLGLGVAPPVDAFNDEDRQQSSPPPVAGGGGEAVTDALEDASDAGTSGRVSGKFSAKISGTISNKVSAATVSGESSKGGDIVVDIAAAGGGAVAGGGGVEVDQTVSEEEVVQGERTDAATAAVPPGPTKGSTKVPPSSSSSQRDQSLEETPSTLASAPSNNDLATTAAAVPAAATAVTDTTKPPTPSPPQEITLATEEDQTSEQPIPKPADEGQPPTPTPPVEGDGVAHDKDLEKEAKEAKIRAANEKRAAIEAAEEEARKALEEKVRQREEKKRQKEQEEADRLRKEAEEEALEKQREKDELLAKIAAQDAEKKRIEAEERSKLGLFGQLMGRKPAPSSSAAKPPRPIRDKDHATTRIQMLFLINTARLRAHRKRMAIAKAQKRAGELVYWAAVTIQRTARGRLGRKKFLAVSILKQRDNNERDSPVGKGTGASRGSTPPVGPKGPKSPKNVASKSPKSATKKQSRKDATGENEEGVGHDTATEDNELAAEKLRQVEEKLARIEEMEKMMQDRERAMREATLEAEERAALMEIRLREFEEKTRQNTEAAEKQQEAMLQNVQNAVNAAASAINMDPDLVNVAMGSPPGTDRLSARNTGRMGRTPRSGRKIPGQGGGLPSAPPSGRSARDPIPPNTPRIQLKGYEWIQLWDAEWNRFYWYCTQSQVSQWEKPKDENAVVVGANPLAKGRGFDQGGDANDSGYNTDTGSVMTDYTMDSYGGGNDSFYSEYGGSDEAYPEWQEFWDESAQAKYWYNNITGEASWTKPPELAGDDASVTSVNPAVAAGPGGADDWVSYIDETTGQEYWYNIKTGESSWA